MNENEKDKEIKKTSEAYSYDDYEGDEMEGAEEGLSLEEASESEGSLFSDINQTARESSVSKSPESEPGSSCLSEEDRNELILREKWLTVTGKKTRNIPVVRKQYDKFSEKVIFFGDRKPKEAEKNIRQKLLISYKKIEEQGLIFGKVRQEIMLPALFGGLLCIKFQPGAEFLAHSDRRGRVQVQKTSTGEVILNLKTLERAEELPVRTMKYFLNTEKLYVGGESGIIQVFDSHNGDLLSFSQNALGVINNLDISLDGNYLATGGRGGSVSVLDPITLQLISKRSWPDTPELYAEDEYHKLRVYGLKFHPTETNIFVTGGWDNSLKVWDVRTHAAIRCIKCPLISGDGVDIANDKIISASWQAENSLNLWDFPSGKLINSIPVKGKFTKFDGEFLYTAKFLTDSSTIYDTSDSNLVACGGGGFTEVMVINTENNKVFPSLKTVLCMDVCGNCIAYGGKESLIRICDLVLTRKSQNTKMG